MYLVIQQDQGQLHEYEVQEASNRPGLLAGPCPP